MIMIVGDVIGRYLNDCVSGSLGDDIRLIIRSGGMNIDRGWRHGGSSNGVNGLILEARMCA